MGSKAYNRGSAFERRIKRELEDAGHYVTKSGGSKGAADFSVVCRNGHPYLIQCKKDGVLSKAEWNKLVEVGITFNCTTLHVCKPKRNEPIRFEYLHTVALLDTNVLEWVSLD